MIENNIGLTDRPTDQRTDGRTDMTSYRDAQSHLKSRGRRQTALCFRAACYPSLYPMSLGVSERANDQVNEHSRVRERSKQCGANNIMCKQMSKQTSGWLSPLRGYSIIILNNVQDSSTNKKTKNDRLRVDRVKSHLLF